MLISHPHLKSLITNSVNIMTIIGLDDWRIRYVQISLFCTMSRLSLGPI